MKSFKDWVFSNRAWLDMGVILMAASFYTSNSMGFVLGIVFLGFYLISQEL